MPRHHVDSLQSLDERADPALRHSAWSTRQIVEHAACRLPEDPQLAPGIRRRTAAERPCVVGAEVGVAHDEPDVAERDADRLGQDDRQAGPVVLAGVDLAGERGHDPVAADVEPRPRRRRPAAGPVGLEDDDQTVGQDLEPVALGGRGHVPGRLRAAVEGNGPCFSIDVGSAVELLGAHHSGALDRRQDPRIRAAATDVVPEPGIGSRRHRGWGVDSSKATADRIMPGVQ